MMPSTLTFPECHPNCPMMTEYIEDDTDFMGGPNEERDGERVRERGRKRREKAREKGSGEERKHLHHHD